MKSRLGIFGGAFDPVHQGHIQAARFALETLDLDAVQMIPCNVPNHKESLSASAVHRMEMLKLALRDEPSITPDDCEMRRGGISYASDTVSAFAESGCWQHRIFVMGMDAFNGLPCWHNWQGFLDSCHILVLGRSGQDVDELVAAELDLERRQVAEPHELFEQSVGKVHLARLFDVELSSTQVRSLLGKDGHVSGLLNPSVINYIEEHSLYGCRPSEQ
ncbi:MAG: nicotinate-nucleotide adenylyltransferase [Pseudomonadota bacterium]|nr:nicotinate-nucleotide adenylyltransferase [Pseudomonadota bacterium]